MKLNYFAYWVNTVKKEEQHLTSLAPFLRAFCSYDNPKFKLKFRYNDEHVFLIHIASKVFLFLMTRSNETIKRIQASDLTVGEIYERLQKGEMLGFASYLYLDDHYFGFASTTMAPKPLAFTHFVNDIFDSVGLGSRYSFACEPILTQTTKADALAMPFIGRSTIQVTKGSTLYEDFRNFIGSPIEDFRDIDSFEVIIKPRRKQDIGQAVKKLINTLPDAGLEKMVLRAREEVHGQMVDLYVAGMGGVSDIIDTKDERKVLAVIEQKVRDNAVLKAKVKEHVRNAKFKKTSLKGINTLSDHHTWTAAIRSVPMGG